MPVFAHLAAVVPCPACGSDLAVGGRVAFQWGYCVNPLHGGGTDYRVGDVVRWRPGPGGLVPAWTYFPGGGGNVGDPQFTDVLVRESEFDTQCCARCGQRVAGIGVRVRGGVIAGVRAYTDGLPASEVSVIDSGGAVVPRPEWDDRARACADGG